MPKDRKDKIIFAGIIFLAFLVANVFSNGGFKDIFNKNEDEIVMSKPDNENLDDMKNKETSSNDLSTEDKKVYISGEVKNSGVYDIKDGDRLDDLVKRAGGFTEKADINAINLALRLEDQMKIYIPNIDENQNINADNTNLAMGEVTSTNPKSSGQKININLASKEELMTLPNIGEKRAQAILDYRQENKFTKIEDIKNVSGIGDKYFEAMKDLITV
ncbi:helix-hairpin-helix domain-containing protein [uncultured Anaerococcus sp.]|uniref:helix-hairpin-helix domain-containing protein n=1 Tax=uncultured Anaerococcus sp. TaxID=293428 RepID=UPI00288C619B|nr:helix-hairpin-helix domain-containing protein [uncultured Anaerococcus sp.]